MKCYNPFKKLKLSQLEYFYVSAKTGSFSKAAKELGISQPTVSVSVQKLESDLNMQLFERSGTSLTMTEQGKLVFSHAENILHELEHMHTGLTQIGSDSSASGAIHIGSCVLEDAIVTKVHEFLSTHQKVRITLEPRNMAVVVPQLEADQFDLAIVPTGALNQKLASVPFGKVEFGVSLPPGHILEEYPVLSPALLNDHDIVMPAFEKGIAKDVYTYFSSHGSTPIFSESSSARNFQTLRFLVNSSGKIAVFPINDSRAVEQIAESRATRRLSPPLYVDFSIAWKREKTISKSLRMLIDFLPDK